MASQELTEGQFWDSVNAQTDGMLAEHENGSRS
jgi:hypothetical protein